jgi:hypothetical protein
MKKINLILLLCLVFLGQNAQAQYNNSTTQAGYWNACATWGSPTSISNTGSGLMYVNHLVTVPAGQTFYFSKITFGPNGKLQYEAGAKLSATSGGSNITCVYPPTVSSITCGSASFSPATLVSGTAYSGTITVPYTGGNGQAYSAGSGIASTGVTGLTATLQAGTLASGSGNLTYSVTGTPSAAGTASFAISFGGQSCTVTKTVSSPTPGPITGSVTYSGSRIECNVPNSLTLTINYTGGNGGAYTPADFSISGCDPSYIFGTSGNLNNGAGTVVVTISVTTAQGVNPCYTDVVFLGQHVYLEIGCSIDGSGGRMSIPRK